jgi:hypothetical protein
MRCAHFYGGMSEPLDDVEEEFENDLDEDIDDEEIM